LRSDCLLPRQHGRPQSGDAFGNNKKSFLRKIQTMGKIVLRVEMERWPLRIPLKITGYTWTSIDVVVVSIENDGFIGRGEAHGVYYRGDTPELMCRQIKSVAAQIEAGGTREHLGQILHPGGARNAIDCALWDLEAKLTGVAVWSNAALDAPRSLLTTFTCSAESPAEMAARAVGRADAKAIKLKLTGEPLDIERVQAVRSARPDVWLGVDANQGFDHASLKTLMPILVEAGVSLIEQPFPVGKESMLDGFRSPIPVAADESAQCLSDLPGLVGRFDVVNIKLDKCGGLTEGLAMARSARELGLDVMVGCMTGTSLAMAPAFLVGQLGTIVDLDGPIFLESDRPVSVEYLEGLISCPEPLWGWP
jgi:L-alanine-DL-glutamate epimerase-like enolase superfamily enzyme